MGDSDRMFERIEQPKILREIFGQIKRNIAAGILKKGYRGCRYSFGYAACPDLAASPRLLELLGADRVGVSLTGSFQMVPEQSTSALVFHHPRARHFSVQA